MKRLAWFPGLMSLALAGALHAQPTAPVTPSSEAVTSVPSQAEREARGRELEARRSAIEGEYKQAMRYCYQQFDVVSCRNQAREKRIAANNLLRKDEQAHNAQERQIKAAEAQQRLLDKQQEALERAQDAQRAVEDAKSRAQRNAEKQGEHTPPASKRSSFDEKQRDAAEHRADVERRAREREKPRSAPLPPPEGAR